MAGHRARLPRPSLTKGKAIGRATRHHMPDEGRERGSVDGLVSIGLVEDGVKQWSRQARSPDFES